MKHSIPTTHQVLERARSRGYAIGAFNVSSFTVLKAVMQAAQKLRSPVIIETSSGETEYLGAEIQAAVLDAYERITNIPVLVNLDHSHTYADVTHALQAGYELLHFDGSKLPKEKNISILKRIVPKAHKHHRLVEGELDHITGTSALHQKDDIAKFQKQNAYTDPDEAAEFVAKTGIDIFASFIGNVHGVYKTPPKLDFQRLRAIRASVPCLLSLHGGSGIRDADVRRAIRDGITKVNVSTELRVAYLSSLRATLQRHPHEYAPYKLMPPVIAAVQAIVEKKIRLFGSAKTA